MRPLAHLIRKELLLLVRDRHALALLFAMPAFFILVMSMAMRDVFKPGAARAFDYYLVNNDTSALARRLETRIRSNTAFHDVGRGTDSARVEKIRDGSVFFAVVIPEGFAGALLDSSSTRSIEVDVGPSVSEPIARLFAASVRGAVTEAYVSLKVTMTMLIAGVPPDRAPGDLFRPETIDRLVSERTLSQADGLGVRPTSVQQNVPAWLVFAMFFVALPLSTTWLQERSQGTLARLRSMGVPSTVLLVGKFIPYVVVNMAQVVVMFAVGVWAVPALGGDSLALGHSVAGLVVMSIAVAIAAVSYALLIANSVATTEQATIVTGATNLLLGALGGVMVPRAIMPLGMQKLSYLSPMAWGVEGFHDILLRDGGVRMIATKVAALLGFAALALAVATFRLRKSGNT